MAVGVLGVDEGVVVDEILVASVVGRIDVDNIYLALVSVGKCG